MTTTVLNTSKGQLRINGSGLKEIVLQKQESHTFKDKAEYDKYANVLAAYAQAGVVSLSAGSSQPKPVKSQVKDTPQPEPTVVQAEPSPADSEVKAAPQPETGKRARKTTLGDPPKA